jgi:hypothetical protein
MYSNTNFVYKSFRDEKLVQKKAKGHHDMLTLEKSSLFFHSNEKFLNSFASGNAQVKNCEQLFRDKNVLLIGHGSASRMPILENLSRYKFNRLVGLCKAKTWAHGLFTDFICADPEKLDSVHETVEAVLDFMTRKNVVFDAIVTYDDYCMEVAMFLANYFDLPSTSFGLLRAIRNKDEFRRLCADSGITHPRFVVIKSCSRARFLSDLKLNRIVSLRTCDSERVQFPVIVKNTTGAGKGLKN